MNELTKTNQNLTKKEALGQYVHDMVDLEIRAFSLRKTVEETRKEAERKENSIKSELSQIEFRKRKNLQMYTEKNAEKQKGFWKLYFSHVGFVFSMIFLLLTIIFLIVFSTTNYDEGFLPPVIIFGSCFVITNIIGSPNQRPVI